MKPSEARALGLTPWRVECSCGEIRYFLYRSTAFETITRHLSKYRTVHPWRLERSAETVTARVAR